MLTHKISLRTAKACNKPRFVVKHYVSLFQKAVKASRSSLRADFRHKVNTACTDSAQAAKVGDWATFYKIKRTLCPNKTSSTLSSIELDGHWYSSFLK